jgi:hypothetical protein
VICSEGFGKEEPVRNGVCADRKCRSDFLSAPIERAVNFDGTGLGGSQMTDQHLWFEPVSLLSRCSLNEGLLWVWADRVPVDTVYREKNVFESLQDWEFERLNIPPAPRGLGRAAQYRTEERLRKRTYRRLLKNAREYHVLTGMEEAETARQWLPLITSAMEVPATELFLKLRYGQIEALGKLLPVGVEIIDFLEDQNSYSRGNFDNLVDSVVPHHFWTQRGIDWFSNAVTADGNCYCDVSMPVEILMSLFPGERTPVEGAEFVGDFLLVKAPATGNIGQAPRRARGRPPAFAWEAFHVECADLIKSGRMPQKKEAAIQQMVSWFASTQGGQTPSRSAVSEKLTPYYRRFFSDTN